jgi:hypothetical protein
VNSFRPEKTTVLRGCRKQQVEESAAQFLCHLKISETKNCTEKILLVLQQEGLKTIDFTVT